MTEWIHGGGFWLVQPIRDFTKEELKADMDKLEARIEEEKRKRALRRELSA